MDLKGFHILVIEDDPAVRELIVEVLTVRHGVRCSQAESVDQALGELRSNSFHAIVADVILKGGNVSKVYDVLVAEGNPLARRILFTTAHLEVPSIEDLCARTGNVLLKKPFTLDEFARAMASVLDQIPTTERATPDRGPEA